MQPLQLRVLLGRQRSLGPGLFQHFAVLLSRRAFAQATELTMLAWYGHAEPDIVAEFEAENNVKFIPKYYTGGDNMLGLISQSPPGTFAVVTIRISRRPRAGTPKVTKPFARAGNGPTGGACTGGSQHHWPPSMRHSASSEASAWRLGSVIVSHRVTSGRQQIHTCNAEKQ